MAEFFRHSPLLLRKISLLIFNNMVTTMTDKNQLWVSVVIPCLNAEETISAAVESARQEQNIKLQIICIDDKSRDATPAILSKLAAEGVIEYIINKKTCGAAHARNQGLNAARGEFIQFLAADDILLPEKLHRQASTMAQNNTDFIAGAYQYHNIHGQDSAHYPDEDCWSGLITSKLGRTSANLFRKKTLTAIKGWSIKQKSSQEYELMYRLLKNDARMSLDIIIGTHIFATHGSISQSNLHENTRRFIALRRDIVKYLEDKKLLSTKQQALYESICERSMAAMKTT